MKFFILLSLTIIVSITFFSVNNSLVLACTNSSNSSSSNLALQGATEAGSNCGQTLIAPGGLATTIVNIITYVAGVIVIFMVIFAGFKYVTSGGDANKVNSAKNTLLYAIVGVAIIVMAQVIVHYVINTTAGAAVNGWNK